MKRIIRLLAIVLSLTITVCSLPVFSVVAEDESLIVRPITEYDVKHVGSFGNAVSCIDGVALQGVTMDRLISWDVDRSNLSNTSSCVLQFNNMSEPLTDSEGFMFYVNFPCENTVSFNIELKNPGLPRWKYSYAPTLLALNSAEYQFLPMGETEWQTGKMVSTFEGRQYGAGMYFADGFEGYIKVPMSSLKNDSGFKVVQSEDKIEKIVFWLQKFGGDYGESVIAPLFTVTQNSNKGAPIIEGVFDSVHPDNTARYVTEFSEVKKGVVSTAKTLPDNSDIPLYSLYCEDYYEIADEKLGGQQDKMLWLKGMKESLYDTEGFLIYLKTPADNRISFYFNLVDPEDSSRWKFSYAVEMSLYVGNSYYVLPRGSSEWTEKQVVSGWSNSYKGAMQFDEAFEGYIKVPYSAFKNDSGFKLKTELDSLEGLSVRFKKIGGDYGAVDIQPLMLMTDDTASDKISVSSADVMISAGETAGGAIAVNRSKAVAGEKISVTASAQEGYCISSRGVTVGYTDFSGAHTVYAEKEAGENAYSFTVPDNESILIGAEFLPRGEKSIAMLEATTEGDDAIRFRLRSSGDGEALAGFLIAPYDTLGNKALTRGLSDVDILDVPCEMSDSFEATGSSFFEYSLLYDGIRKENLTRFFSVRGYAETKDGIAYSDTVTVSYDTLKNGYLPDCVSFGDVTGRGGYYLLNTASAESSSPFDSEATVIKANTLVSKDALGTQNSPYWFSTTYSGMNVFEYSHIMIYLDMPIGSDNYLFMTARDSNGKEYRLRAGDEYILYSKNSTIPQKMRALEGSNINWGIIMLPAGFEGFLSIPIRSLYQRTAIGATTEITTVNYRFSHIGTTTDASPVVGGVFGAKQSKAYKNESSVVTEIGGADSKYRIDDKAVQMTDDSALIYFDEVSSAENYRVSAYKRVMGGYELQSRCTLYSNSGAISGLCENEDYIISIAARDKRDNILAELAPLRLEFSPDSSLSGDMRDEGIIYDNVYSASATGERSFTPLSASNSALLSTNPNRGFRGCVEFYHFNITDSAVKSTIDSQINKFVRYSTDAKTYVLYLYPGDYLEGSLGDEFYTTTQKIFDYFREKKLQILLRFAYYDVNNFNKRTPTTDEILRHISELSENGIIERNKDIIHAFQVGFVGQFGEWHSDNPKADRGAVLTAFANKLLPDGVYSQIRMPAYKDFLADTNAKKKLIGFHIDSFFGIMDGTELGSGEYSYGLPQWERQMSEGAYTPNDAELYYWGQYLSMGMYAEGYGSAIASAQLRLTTLSAVNGYLDQSINADSCMNYWKRLPVTEQWLEFNNLPMSPMWFKNNDGSAVSRNVFEYIRDHLGYRISAQKIKVRKENSGLGVELDLVNYGFSAAFNISSEIVLLDSKNNVIDSVSAGDPATWYGSNPSGAPDGKLLTHTVSATLKKPTSSAQYKIALRLTSKSGETARLDNNVSYEDGYNILYVFNY